MSQWIRVVVDAVLAGSVASLAPAAAQAGHVSGRITIQEKNNAPSPDLGDAVVYLEGQGGSLPAARFEITISDKTFSPHVLVVPSGSTVAFPNHDPFDHNVFSVSDSNSFDLGLYGRGEGKTTVLKFPGLVRVFCNVHPRMVSLVLVMATHHFAQAGADGSGRVVHDQRGRAGDLQAARVARARAAGGSTRRDRRAEWRAGHPGHPQRARLPLAAAQKQVR